MSLIASGPIFGRRSSFGGMPAGGRYYTAAERKRVEQSRVPDVTAELDCGNCGVRFWLLSNESAKTVRCPTCEHRTCPTCKRSYLDTHPKTDCMARRIH